jgi:hypothetical protein
MKNLDFPLFYLSWNQRLEILSKKIGYYTQSPLVWKVKIEKRAHCPARKKTSGVQIEIRKKRPLKGRGKER